MPLRHLVMVITTLEAPDVNELAGELAERLAPCSVTPIVYEGGRKFVGETQSAGDDKFQRELIADHLRREGIIT